MKEAGSWPQQGGITYSQQLHENYDNQISSCSSSAQSDIMTVEDMSFVQQGAFIDAKETGNRPLGQETGRVKVINHSRSGRKVFRGSADTKGTPCPTVWCFFSRQVK